ncbi:MAG TPA: DinB family protein [Saprospiraceae bacterium]|nr:DinB family protein [Saprospiraceae bacterium]HMQ82951.1 DinB family protein [Saprospiraceae bacterium]
MAVIALKPWFERQFPVVGNDSYWPLLERLEGTPMRIKAKFEPYPDALLQSKVGAEWSVLENIGHLVDLEPLWIGRVSDIAQGLEFMRPADLSNRQTHEADHNTKTLEELWFSLTELRTQFLDLLQTLSSADLDKAALHPRLKTPMKIVDLMYFVAEHDDHHLATCSMLLKKSQRKRTF